MKMSPHIYLLTVLFMVIVLSSFQDAVKYNGEVHFTAEVLKNKSDAEPISVRTKLTNTTADTIVYIREECERSTSYYFDPCKGPRRIVRMTDGRQCFWNGAVRFQLAPHSSAIDIVDLWVKRPDKKFRVGFNYIALKIFNTDSLTKNLLGEMVPGWEFAKVKNIIWSDTLEIK